jgi:hypothetical protein
MLENTDICRPNTEMYSTNLLKTHKKPQENCINDTIVPSRIMSLMQNFNLCESGNKPYSCNRYKDMSHVELS